MAIVSVSNIQGDKVAEIELSDQIFNVPVRSYVLHEVVTTQLNNRRRGTVAVKDRAAVSGGGAKPFRQKGTGRARAGSRRSPLWRGGGTTHGPVPKEYNIVLPKKVRRLALRMALSGKLKNNGLIVLDAFDIDTPKTRRFVDAMQALKVGKALLVTDSRADILELSARNVPGFKVLCTEGLNVYDILKYESLILMQPSIKKIEERLLP